MDKQALEEIKGYFGEKPLWYYQGSQQIFAKDEKIGDKLILDMRGWASLCRYEREKHPELSPDLRETYAMNLQDTIGHFIAEAINEKIESESV